jgi:hypothetical protein
VAEVCTRKKPRRVSRCASTFTCGGRLLRATPLLVLLLALHFSVSEVSANGEGSKPGKLKGTVSIGDGAARSYVPAAKVLAIGPITVQTEANSEGKFAFGEMPAGSYTVTASETGLDAQQIITLQPNQILQISLQLKPTVAVTTVNVSAPDSAAGSPTPTQTIRASTLRDAPNMNERMETLLPLVPGVVRGPDGRINMKGARNTQSGALVNSANVTDPVTGSPAINLPIDVVESVQVVSNPYDPQYGRFTGAVSSVETKTGSYQSYHYSIQNVLPRLRDRDGSIVGIGAATPRMTLSGPAEAGPMAGKTYRRHLRAHESQDFSADQPANHKAADHTEYGQHLYSRRRTRLRHLFRLRRLLEHARWRGSIGLGEHSGRLRWRSRAAEADGIRFRLLARDCVRLVVLPLHLCRNDDRTFENSGSIDCYYLGKHTTVRFDVEENQVVRAASHVGL